MWIGCNYERFSCGEHLLKTRRLIQIDRGSVLYKFEPVTHGWLRDGYLVEC